MIIGNLGKDSESKKRFLGKYNLTKNFIGETNSKANKNKNSFNRKK